jgi:hypothetical protein
MAKTICSIPAEETSAQVMRADAEVRTLSGSCEQRVQRREHGLAAFKTVPLQIRKLGLEELRGL